MLKTQKAKHRKLNNTYSKLKKWQNRVKNYVQLLTPELNKRLRQIMHEMSLAEGIVKQVEEAAHADGCSKVKVIWVEIGQLAAVEREALQFCFDAVTRDGIAEGACLKIIETPGQGRCMKCKGIMAVATLYEPCPFCGNYQIQINGGSEMRIKEIEVE